MATVNLGRIKPVFRGAYNNSTSYVIDDIVTASNETFIAIAATQGNATTDASKWTKLAAKGADGTDVAAVLNNNEIAFKTNAGALDGIAIGTAGQALKVNSGANGYEFGSANSVVASSYPSSSIGSGYEKNINGLIIQWGTWTLGGNSSGSVSFPLTFPNYIFALTLSLQNNAENNNSNLENTNNPSLSGFSWHQGNNGQSTRRGYYIAIGK